jgi:NAD(P)H-hydrate epimerase
MSDPPFTLTGAEVRELDHRAIEGFGVPGIVLMENAGRGCAELLMRLNPDRKPVVILCGPGNNGGDGFVVARHLDNHGWPATVFAVECPGPPDPKEIRTGWDYRGLPHDARTNWDIVRRSRIDLRPLSPLADPRVSSRSSLLNPLANSLLPPGGWVVDALFGTGLTRPLGPPFDEYVAQINASGHRVLAVDIPSGLDCDTGEPLGPAVRATYTATFVAPKRGFLNPASRDWTGEVHVIDIGAPRVLVEEYRGRATRGDS